MTRRVEYARVFERDVKRLARRYRHIRQDLEPLLEALIAGDTPGDRIQNIDAVVYKERLPNTDAKRGKSGGYRVIYYLVSDELTSLLTLYSKTDQDDIPAREIQQIINEVLGGQA